MIHFKIPFVKIWVGAMIHSIKFYQPPIGSEPYVKLNQISFGISIGENKFYDWIGEA